MAIINVKNFDNLYVFYPVMQTVAYILYLLRDIKHDYTQNENDNNVQLQDSKFDKFFCIFNVAYIIFLFVLFNATMNVIVLSFALYPLGLKVTIIDAIFIKDAACMGVTKIGEK
ncbi:hypothetical protein [Aminipila sp.]|uniref:hypothetical protein n=1 Tax=Aminipila sp. TaxID=2060095 RepID=UPI00289D89B1|nr:hypothetical protein [Aminipila sp.]